MKTLVLLEQESAEIQVELKRLLTDNFRFDHSINEQKEVMARVVSLRNNLSVIQREIRERISA